MHMKKLIALTCVMMIFNTMIDAYVPFNPIIKKGGSPLKWPGKRYGIVGWLEVPDKNDRVLMLKKNDGTYAYIHPQNPDVQLPRGLFMWQSGWDFKSPQDTDLKKHAVAFEGLWKAIQPSELDAWLQIQPQKSFFGMKQGLFVNAAGQKLDLNNPALHDHPSSVVSNFFRWTPDEIHYNLQDRLFFIHGVLGVTENYFRDFFGGKNIKPSSQEVKTYFPAAHADFPERQAIAQSVGLLKVLSVQELRNALAKKKPNTMSIGKGSVKLIDGYQIYIDNGGQFPTNAELKKLLEKKGGKFTQTAVNLQAQFLDSPAAQAGRAATDVRRLLADPSYKDAIFQDAATRYLLEGGMERTEKLLTDMLRAPVQGEETSIATAARSFVLKYLEPRYDIFDDFYQEYNQINAIPADLNAYKKLSGKVKVGWYPDVAVTSGFWRSYVLPYPGQPLPKPSLDFAQRILFLDSIGRPSFKTRIVGNIFNSRLDKKQKVNLALVAGLNLQNKGKSDKLKGLAQILIDAAYEATLLLAAVYDRRQIILTLVGAGAFAGDYGDEVMQWIIDFLKNEEYINLISAWGLELIIINYPDLRPHRLRSQAAIQQFSDEVKELDRLVQQKNITLKQSNYQHVIQLTVELEALAKRLQ